ncbi:hypothetical protein SUGI_1055980 [Cryptomeria japonica]|nr:hypothetical protein SUGI_1055980 [Cryptomeria japonica]
MSHQHSGSVQGRDRYLLKKVERDWIDGVKEYPKRTVQSFAFGLVLAFLLYLNASSTCTDSLNYPADLAISCFRHERPNLPVFKSTLVLLTQKHQKKSVERMRRSWGDLTSLKVE